MMRKYTHPHTQMLTDDQKVVSGLEAVIKTCKVFHDKPAYQCMAIEDADEFRQIEERLEAIQKKYKHNQL